MKFIDHIKGMIQPSIQLDNHKTLSLHGGNYHHAPLFNRYLIPLNQYDGNPAIALVKTGDYVLKNQVIAHPSSELGVFSHAPTSGLIGEKTETIATHPSHFTTSAIEIVADGLDKSAPAMPALANEADWQQSTLVERIHQAGICGMGGAGFPTEKKINLDIAVNTLIVNGAECEPYVTCDEVLMQQHANAILLGAKAVAFIIGASQVIIAIEDEKQNAIQAMQQAIIDLHLGAKFSVVALPTRYPMGSHHQLADYLLGIKTAVGRRSYQYNFVCHNVATLKACYDAIYLGLPLISRLTTFSGNAYQTPQVLNTRIGTQLTDINNLLGLTDTDCQLVMGGSMMGFVCHNPQMALKKESIAVLAFQQEKPLQTDDCIRCGKCADACPMDLLPQQLHYFSQGQDLEKLQQFNLFDCIECGLCNYVCPSHIPLVQQFQCSKGEVLAEQHKKQFASHAKTRYESRLERLERNKQRRQQQLEEKRKKLAIQTDNSQADIIAEALARVAAKKAQAAKDKQDSQNHQGKP